MRISDVTASTKYLQTTEQKLSVPGKSKSALWNIRQAAEKGYEFAPGCMANTMEDSGYVFIKALEGLFIDGMDQNEEITARYMNEKEFQKIAGQNLLERVYRQIRTEEASA